MNHQNNSDLTLKYYWKKSLVYKWNLLAFFFFVILAIVGQTFWVTLLYKDLFDLLADNAGDKNIIFDEAVSILIIILLVHFFTTIVGWRCATFLNNFFQPAVMRDIEDDCFEKLQNHSFDFFMNKFSGGLVSKTNRFVKSFEMMADVFQWEIAPIFIRFIGSFVAIVYFLPMLAWIFLGWMFIYVYASYRFANWKLKYDKKVASIDSKVTGELADNITNILNVKIFAGKKFEINRFRESIFTRYKARKLAWDLSTLMEIFQGVAMTTFQFILMYFLVSFWKEGNITLGTIFAIQMFVWILFENLWNLGRSIQNFYTALADAEEMTEILNQVPDILDIKNPQKCKIKKGNIEFKNINFGYGEDKNEEEKNKINIFENFDLKIPAGEKIGLVGESGAGKSTFVNLLLRFMDVDSGKILIDGQDIKKIEQDDLRRNISYVPQEPILFHRSLKENILYGNPEASKKEMIEASRNAHAHDFIELFEDKYETLVGERGVKLSGGQKQRVAIARAMLKFSPVLILDEATSALDSKAEKFIQDGLDKLMKNRTTLVIAHRLSTLRQMDRIIVFAGGKIVEEGSHENLLKQKGHYAELWNHQSGGFVK